MVSPIGYLRNSTSGKFLAFIRKWKECKKEIQHLKGVNSILKGAVFFIETLEKTTLQRNFTVASLHL